MRGILIVISILFSGIIFAGCIGEYKIPVRKYSTVSVYFVIDSTEVERINTSEIQPPLEAIGFSLTCGERGFTLRNWSGDLYPDGSPRAELEIVISPTTNISNASVDVWYMPSYLSNSSVSRNDANEKDNISAYIKTRTNEVAVICNITLDWNKARWLWQYKD
ncbi:MAG: hypothetical protein WC974_03620 [Thermoplasmata archaeon]